MNTLRYTFAHHNAKSPELAAKFIAKGHMPTGFSLQLSETDHIVGLFDDRLQPIAAVRWDNHRVIEQVDLQTVTNLLEQQPF